MEVWLAGSFLPLLLLAWLPAGESHLCSELFHLCVPLQEVWDVAAAAFSSPLAAFNSPFCTSTSPCAWQSGVSSPPATACAQAAGSARRDPISGSRALNQHRLQQQGEKTVGGKGRKQRCL